MGVGLGGALVGAALVEAVPEGAADVPGPDGDPPEQAATVASATAVARSAGPLWGPRMEYRIIRNPPVLRAVRPIGGRDGAVTGTHASITCSETLPSG